MRCRDCGVEFPDQPVASNGEAIIAACELLVKELAKPNEYNRERVEATKEWLKAVSAHSGRCLSESTGGFLLDLLHDYIDPILAEIVASDRVH